MNGDGGEDQEVSPPTSEGDIARFLVDVQNHPDYKEIIRRLGELADESAESDVRLWSETVHKSGDKWKLARRCLHRRLVRQTLQGKPSAPPETKPKAMLLIGTPGSGKTSVGMPHAQAFGVDFVIINADDVKARLPEYEGWNAGALHEESSYVAEDLIYSRAVKNRQNVLLDLTGTNAEKMLGLVDDLDELGYDVHVILVSLPAWKAAARAWQRFRKNPLNRKPGAEPGRFVPPEYVYEIVGDRPAETYRIVKEHPAVRSWMCLNTNESPAQIVEKGSR